MGQAGTPGARGGPGVQRFRFGPWLKDLHLGRGWSAVELARRLSVEVSGIYKVERGERSPSPQLLAGLAQLLGVPVASLLPGALAISRARSVPTAATSFVGREHEIETVAGLFDASRLVTLVGGPGVGKTRLATEVTRRLQPGMAHGACVADLLAAGAPAGVVDAVRRALRFPEGMAGPCLDSLVEQVRDQQVCLLLDNFDHVMDATDVVVRLLADAPELRILVTSREALRVSAETVYRVRGLPVLDLQRPLEREVALASPAVALFVERARKVQCELVLDSGAVQAIVHICGILDGTPLDIELAAADVAYCSPEVVLARLRQGRAPAGQGRRDGPAHHRSSGSAIAWSYERLPDTEKRVLAQIGVFENPFTPEAAGHACGSVESDFLPVLGALADRNLLTPCSGRVDTTFSLVHSIRRFALDRLAEAGGVDVVLTRHAQFYLGLAEKAAPGFLGRDQARWLSRLDLERANLGAAIAWSLAHRPEWALRLGAALWRWFWIRGELREGRDCLARALDGDGPPGARVQTLIGAGVLARTQGEVDPARRFLRDAGGIARQAGDMGGLALAELNLAIVDSELGEPTAEARLQGALAAFREIGDPRGVAHATNWLAIAAVRSGDFVRARAGFETSLAAFEELADDWSAAFPLVNLGWVAAAEKRWCEARGWYEAGLATYELLGDERGAAHARANLSRLAWHEGDRRTSVTHLADALTTFVRLGEQPAIVEQLELCAAYAERQGQAGAALRLLAFTDNLRTRVGSCIGMAERSDRDRVECRAGARVGHIEAAAEAARGRALTLDHAVTLALDAVHPVGNRRPGAALRMTPAAS